ncbi:MAG: UDP-N-acetylmuramoyl-L-alanyl-D-glutamate--2,6-diaminopimelate ligase [Planctomyces sp.]|nr:UDP-N-acetylmuramoyl-L-alanyl-D-glutamate--2,6-diaminopimelate ligase [Planctomyces sp.]
MQRTRSPAATVSLRRLFPQASFVGCADVAVSRAVASSQECTPGCLFAALPGTVHDGRTHVADAISRGAAAVLTPTPLANVRVPQCVVADVRAAYSELCQAISGFPSRRLGLVGVTGTNGKTTTTWLVRSILEAQKFGTGLLGTIEYSDGQTAEPAELTTPDSRALADWLAAMVAARTRYAAIELSSHALDQQRASGVQLDVAIVTNITRDHFDYHGDLEAYRAAKSRILSMLKRGGLIVLNADDPESAGLAEQVPPGGQVCLIGLQNDAHVSARILDESLIGTRFSVTHGSEQCEFFTPLIGRHNVLNCLAAVAAARHFGLSLEAAADGVATLTTVPGRLERVIGRQPFHVFVDYAHTDDALRNVIAAVRPMTRGRVITVFGAGGNRDASKRPLMARAAAASDLCVVTTDNPRHESPEAIIEQVCAGFDGTMTGVHVEADRETAIAWAIRSAQPGDTLLICGKGHERVQVVGDERIPFDDVAACSQHLFHYRVPRRAAS